MERKSWAAVAFLCLYGYAAGFPMNDTFHAPTFKNCGKSMFDLQSPDRIVGGTNAKHGQFPWMVSLHEEQYYGFDHICGASIINKNWILTAAHCIDYVGKPYKYKAVVGLHKLSKQNAPTVQKYKINKIVIHKNYDEATYENDIALLRTSQPIDIKGSGGYVNAVCLPKKKKDPSGYATVIGWGHTRTDGENSDTLKQVVVPIIPREYCNEAYDDNPHDEYDEILENMICAGANKKDSCQNDSGGPLFQVDSKGVATLVGIVSHGADCGAKFFPGVYTRVDSFLKWIDSVIN